MPTIEQVVKSDKQSWYNFPTFCNAKPDSKSTSLFHLKVMSATLTYKHSIIKFLGVNTNKRILKTYMYSFAVAYQDE